MNISIEQSYKNVIKYLLIIFVFNLSCKSENYIDRETKVSNFDFNEVFYQKLVFQNETYDGEREIEFQVINKEKYQLGEYAKDKNGEITKLKIGLWKTYYDNGQIKDEGEYLIGRYVQCCAGGYCMQYYNYKVGDWNYYYKNGKLKLKGKFGIMKFNTSTSCGGDYLKFGMLNRTSKFYDSNGKRIKKITDSMKLEFEKMYLPKYHAFFVPNSAKNEIEVVFIK
ncbi:hypothetical protein GCM10009430_37610 [Aquimarina litoralis]|uniref:MORN repeat variant n=1 Tax=Aquimarina litoralis TaxID=584605 RepID=A0ABP3UCL3_9FLAO